MEKTIHFRNFTLAKMLLIDIEFRNFANVSPYILEMKIRIWFWAIHHCYYYYYFWYIETFEFKLIKVYCLFIVLQQFELNTCLTEDHRCIVYYQDVYLIFWHILFSTFTVSWHSSKNSKVLVCRDISLSH